MNLIPRSLVVFSFVFQACSAPGAHANDGGSSKTESSTSSGVGDGGADASVEVSPNESMLRLSSPEFTDGQAMPDDVSCAGAGKSPALMWTGAPGGTAEFALLMTTLARDGLKYNWVLYGVPAGTTSLPHGATGIGSAGLTSNGPNLAYAPPCSPGPGTKTYTFTIYALSERPTLPADPKAVTGEILEKAIESITLEKASLDGTHTTVP